MGKSGQICRKIAATIASTGTSSFFLHAGEAVHGDLGMFARGDVCLAVSNSGTTQEVAVALLPGVKRLGLPLIAITGGMQSRRSPRPPTSCSTSRRRRKPARWAWRRRRAPPSRWRSATRSPSRCSNGAGFTER